MTERVPLLGADQIGSKPVRFPSTGPIPNVTDTSVDPYAPTRISSVPQVEGLEFLPQTADRYPGIVLLHEWWGLTSQIKDVGFRLAREGYTVLIPNLYARLGGMVTANGEVAAMLMARVKEADVLQDVASCCEFLNTQDRVQRGVHAVVGFGMGGTFAMRFASHRKRLRAAVAFYGALPSSSEQVRDLVCPVLYHHAGQNPLVSHADVTTLQETAKTFGRQVDVRIYEDAPVAFFNDTLSSAYRPDLAGQAWETTISFLKSIMK
jgi:carboxymethylenebutenolidase